MEPQRDLVDVRRWLTLTLVVAAAAVAVSALGPSRAFAASGPLVNSKYADRPIKPTAFSPNNLGFNNYVRGVEWTTWGGAEAEGVGRVSLLRGDGSTSPVKVFLSAPARCAGIRVYTAYHLLLEPGATKPNGWPKGQSGRFPCKISVGHYSGQRLGPPSEFGCIDGLLLPAGNSQAQLRIAPWRPAPPGGGRFSVCQLRFGNWGQQRTNGTGVAWRFGGPNGQRLWPMRIWLNRPIWCPRAGQGFGGAITYGKLRIRLQGDVAGAGQRRAFVQEIAPSTSRCRLGRGEGA